MEAASPEPGGAAPWHARGESPADAHAAAVAEKDAFTEHPEVFVGAAFAGGLVVAGLLRWLGRE